MGRPATGKTPLRNIRVAAPIWGAAKARAKAEGRTLTDVLVSYLKEYGAGWEAPASDDNDAA